MFIAWPPATVTILWATPVQDHGGVCARPQLGPRGPDEMSRRRSLGNVVARWDDLCSEQGGRTGMLTSDDPVFGVSRRGQRCLHNPPASGRGNRP